MSIKQTFVLVSVIPSVLFLLLIVLAAGMGIGRWRRMTQVLATIALALLIFGVVFLRTIVDVPLSNRIPDTIVYQFQPYATPAILYSNSIGSVGAFLALVLAARSCNWVWFTILAVAEIISTVAALAAFNSFSLEIFLGSERALSLFLSPLYAVIMSVLVSLTLVAQLLYTFINPQAKPVAAPVAATVSMSDDMTLP